MESLLWLIDACNQHLWCYAEFQLLRLLFGVGLGIVVLKWMRII